MKKVLVSIVNGNRSGYIHPCVESIINKSGNISYDIIVIDNCTGDTNLEKLEQQGVKVIINDSPMGFSQNHSQILPFLGDYEYLLIFNDDAFFENNVLGHLVNLFEDNNGIAIAGPRILGGNGELQPSAAPFPTLTYFVKNALGLDNTRGDRCSSYFSDYIDYSKSQDVDWVSGCCMLISRDFIESNGFLDTGYFMFVEDADLCRRAHQTGKRVRYSSEAAITHYGGGSSTSGRGLIRPFLFVETHRSRLRYLRKHSFLHYGLYFIFLGFLIPMRTLKRAMLGDRSWSVEVWQRIFRKP